MVYMYIFWTPLIITTGRVIITTIYKRTFRIIIIIIYRKV